MVSPSEVSCVLEGGHGTAVHFISGPQSGILSALPFVAGWICIILGGLLADFLLSRKILRLITIRKLFTAIGKERAGHRSAWEPLAQAACPSFCVSLHPRGPRLIGRPCVSALGQIQPRSHHGLLGPVCCLQQLQPIRSPSELRGHRSSVGIPLPPS